MNSTVFTLRLDSKLKKRLANLARSMRCSKSFLAVEAIREYLAINEWQISEIDKAVKEADRHEFASDREIRKVLNKWKNNAR